MTSLQNLVVVKLNMSVNVIKVATKRIKIGCKTFNPKDGGGGGRNKVLLDLVAL